MERPVNLLFLNSPNSVERDSNSGVTACSIKSDRADVSKGRGSFFSPPVVG